MRASSLVFIFFSLILSASQILAFRQLGYEIKDLQEIEKGSFEQEASHWKVYGLVSENKTTIARESETEEPHILFGGPGILKALKAVEYSYFERVYTNLPSHKAVGITGILWYYNDRLVDLPVQFGFLRIEGETERIFPSVVPLTNFNGEDSKSSLYSLENIRFKSVSSHKNSTLILKIYSLVARDPSEQSFGFRELTIHLSNFSASDSTMLCDKFEGGSNSTSGTCLCPLNQAPDKNKVCQNCAESCEICFGPKPVQCLLCAPGTHWNGKECNKCHPNCQTCNALDQYNCKVCSPGIFHYDNGSCLETCEWPFRKSQTVMNPNSCTKACKPDEYEWAESDTCLARCDSPLIKSTRGDGVMTCQSPCPSIYNFILTNGSCVSACPIPLVAEFINPLRFCKNPCHSTSDYLYANRSCLKECPSPLQIRSEPGINYCENPCHSKNLYLYNNGSCLSGCYAPMKQRTEFGVKYCLLPCNSKTEYILNDGSCSKECPAPRVKKFEAPIGTYCLNPCRSDDLFVYQNGSCLEACPSPLVAEIANEIKYCTSPCLTNQHYFYQNRTCLDTCPYPLKIIFDAGISVCQSPCFGQSSSFLYDDQSCYESCPSPLTSIIAEGGVNYCKSPCSQGGKYLDEDGKCIEQCEYPFEVIQKGSYNFCMIDMNKVQSAQVDSIKHIVQTSTTISEFGGLLSCFILPGDPTSILVMPVLQMFSEIKIMNIVFPTQIKVLLDEQHHILGGRILTETETSFRMTENLKDKFCLLGVLVGVTLLLTCLQSVVKLPSLAVHASLALKWNILIPVFCSFYYEIVLYSSLEFGNLELGNISGISRFVICLAVIVLATFIPIKVLIIWQKGTTENEKENWRFLFEVYKPKRLFVFIHILRILVFSIVVSYLRSYPQIQASLVFSTSLMMIIYLVWRSPIENKLCYLQHIILESLLAIYNLLVFTLSILDALGKKASEFRNIIDGIMTVESLGAPVISVLLISFKVICSFYFLQKDKNNDFVQISRINSSEQDAKEDPEIEEIITNITINKGDSPTLNPLNVNVSVTNTDTGTIKVQIRRSSGCLIKIEEKASDGGIIVRDEWN